MVTFCSSLPGPDVFLLRLAGLPAMVLLSIISSLFLLYQRMHILPLSSSTCPAEFLLALAAASDFYFQLNRQIRF